MKDKTALVALNGELRAEPEAYLSLVTGVDLVVAADGGALLLARLDIKPDIVIGDLDSLQEKDIARLETDGVKIKKYPQQKDEIDGELALTYCLQQGYRRAIILGALGGRYDQQLANIYLLEYFLNRGGEALIREPGLEIGLIAKYREFNDLQGCRFSLLPLSQKVTGIVNSGFKYSLKNEELIRYRTRGISNIITEDWARIKIENGLLIYLLDKNNQDPV